jgi:hypothetical protein
MNAGHGGKSGRDGAIKNIRKNLIPWSWKIKTESYITYVSRLMGLAKINLLNKKGEYYDK